MTFLTIYNQSEAKIRGGGRVFELGVNIILDKEWETIKHVPIISEAVANFDLIDKWAEYRLFKEALECFRFDFEYKQDNAPAWYIEVSYNYAKLYKERVLEYAPLFSDDKRLQNDLDFFQKNVENHIAWLETQAIANPIETSESEAVSTKTKSKAKK